jgi:histidine triad (HIT) family protein
VIPKRHVASLDHAVEQDALLLGRMLLVAKTIAAAEGCANGYRVVTNCGPSAGQSVWHVHLHVLGGRPMAWPPG